MTGLIPRLRRFRSDQDGTLSIEAVIIFPILIYAIVATYSYFDAFRNSTIADRASYTLADMLSREKGYVTPVYIQSLHRVQQIMSNARSPSRVRYSVITNVSGSDAYDVVWSRGTDGVTGLSKGDVSAQWFRDQMPLIASGDQLILVETWTDYAPPLPVLGFGATTFQTFTVTRPRNAAKLCWNAQEDGDASTEIC